MSHKPTPEQQAILDFARETKTNLSIQALAGAAKTSTLVMIANELKDEKILCLAFNKKIATEMTERLPSNCQAMTLNSLGHRVWAECLGKRIILEKDKNFQILTSIIRELSKREQEQAYEEFADTLKIIDFGKSCGYIPTGHHKNAKRLMDDSEFFAHLEDEPSALQERLVRETSVASINQALEGRIDFGDQIMMPTLFPAMFPHFPVVMVDEAQDLSALNHATLRKLAKRRLIAVGDPNQAIYGFRGAHEDSMNLLQQTFSMESKILSISFRCPINVVREAQWRAPHMQWPEWAVEGSVKALGEWDAQTVPETAAIICRNNAPLFNMAIKLLKNGRYPQIIGNDIGKMLLKIMKKFGKASLDRVELEIAIDQWCEDKMKKSRNKGKIIDQAACMKIFASQGENLGDALAYAEHLFNSQGPIQLMTGHKSKGLEFDTVFILDRHLINIEEGQEKNLLYVMQTRAKKELYYVDSGAFFDEIGE
jgi:DNA helicase II / ATP-dependent DNA helicase PcrA